jgi:multisubunit Na+/H+ antiporter MnhF subunit
MADAINPAATEHLPSFIAAPGQTDVLMVVMTIFLVLVVLLVGVLFFRLHTLPERIAHKSQKLQFEIVAVLGLIALFTHMHIFWVIGLILALIDFPDFGTPLRRIARSVEKLAGIRLAEDESELPPAAGDGDHVVVAAGAGRDGSAVAVMPESVQEQRKERGHA